MARILVIDDEPSTRLLLESRIRDLGHDVVACETGALGLARAREGNFDLFLVDVHLGSGIDGYEVCRRLRMMPPTSTSPVVLVSGRVQRREEMHVGYEAGCVAYLLKTDMPQLTDVLQAMLRLKSLQDDLAMQNRLLEERNRRLQEERQRGAELEAALRDSGARATVFRELAAGKPDGVLLVDAEGLVQACDRSAMELLGRDLLGNNLGSLARASGLEAFVRDCRTEPRDGYRFDVPARAGRSSRSLTASVIPFVPEGGEATRGWRVVMLQDASKRRIVAEMLRLQEQGLPRRELGVLVEAARARYSPSSVLGTSPQSEQLRAALRHALHLQTPVLLSGPTGIGKGHAARVLHYSGTSSGSFVPVDCQALSQDSAESELFGCLKDSIPGAYSDRPGLVHQAAFGTLYLSQVHDLSIDQQRRIAQLIERGEVTRLGANRAEHVELRVIASSDEDCASLARSGRMAKELLDLLAPQTIAIPSLRERPEDVRAYVQAFLRQRGTALGVEDIESDALWLLEQFTWAGEVGELCGVLERACQQCHQLSERKIEARHLPAAAREAAQSYPTRELQPAARREHESRGRSQSAADAPRKPLMLPGQDPAAEVPASLRYFEKVCLQYALSLTEGDKLKAAKLLGIGKSTFYRKLARHGIS